MSSSSPSPSPPTSPLASLPDSAPSSDDELELTSSIDSEEAEERTRRESDAEREWKESLQQLELLLTMVLVPYAGKYFGRKCAYWGWAKFMQWQYPDVSVVVTSKKTFKTAGAVEAAASL